MEDGNSEGASEESSSSGVQQDLERFRLEWKAELASYHKFPHDAKELRRVQSLGQLKTGVTVNDVKDKESSDVLTQAKQYFTEGLLSEQRGRLNEAISYYRKAVQLVPDVENRIDYRSLFQGGTSQEKNNDDESDSHVSEDEQELVQKDLISQLQYLGIASQPVCYPFTKTKKMHISDLPQELLVYILRWVVSAEIDVSSLEKLAQVSRGFYLCCRDENLWKHICRRVWAQQITSPGKFDSYRNMYYQRPHIRFNGCYISKMEYFREGEQNLDGFYRTYNIVEYFRFARFFPDGQVLMMVSADEPSVAIHRLRQRNVRMQGLLKGQFYLTGDVVTAKFKRMTTEYNQNKFRYKRRSVPADTESDKVFKVEWLLTKAGKRLHSQLVWKSYQLISNSKKVDEMTTYDFDISNTKNYPALLFSRVKSYALMSEKPL